MTHVKYGTVYIHNHDAIRNMVTFSFYKNRKPQPAESAEMFKTASAAAVRARHKEAAEAEAARVLQGGGVWPKEGALVLSLAVVFLGEYHAG